MRDLKIKIITGFRKDQSFTVDAEEAHKAYYLFLNPDERGVFDNGIALVGKNIQEIKPDYHASMGWNGTHYLDDYDWIEIRKEKIDSRLKELLYEAKQVAQLGKPEAMTKKLSEAKQLLLK